MILIVNHKYYYFNIYLVKVVSRKANDRYLGTEEVCSSGDVAYGKLIG